MGTGAGVAKIARLRQALSRTPALAARLLARSGQHGSAGSQAAWFAARQATASALGGPPALRWTAVTVAVTRKGTG
ncbi:MAG: hypothetical protein ACLQDY_08260 [Streptosporangiaceae bacterium]